MLESTELGLLFLQVAGAVVIFYGISLLAEYFKQHSSKNVLTGEVQNCSHEERRDDKDRLIQYFYKINVRYEEGKNIKAIAVDDTTSRKKGDKVRLIRDGHKVKILKETYPHPVSALISMACGAGMIAFPYLMNRAGYRIASIDASVVMILAALSILITFLADKSRMKTASQIKGEISDLLLFETEKNTHKRIMRAPDTFYPVIRFSQNGDTREFLSRYSTNSKNIFKIGQEMTIYCNIETGEIIEKKPNVILLGIAALLIILAVTGLVSVL